MTVRSLLAGLLLGGALALTCGASTSPIPHWRGSWADGQHVWAGSDDFLGSVPEACELPAIACGSEDGGATWHPILRFTDTHFAVTQVWRTSARAGVLGLLDRASFRGWKYFWTVDAGRHWFRTRLFGNRHIHTAGQGRFVYWFVNRVSPPEAKALYRTKPWPPPGRPGCAEKWVYDLSSPESPPTDEWGAVCMAPDSAEGFHTVLARRFRWRVVRDFATVRSGAVAALEPIRGDRPELLLFRSGREHLLRLPKGRLPRARTSLGVADVYADWPSLVVDIPVSTYGSRHPRLLGCAFWESRNGGRTWRTRFVAVEAGRDTWDTERWCML